MASKELTLSESFEISGDWWLPDSRRRIPGVLRLTPRVMKLYLDGALGESDQRGDMLEGEFVVFGIDETGERWSLQKCLESSLSPAWIPDSNKKAKSEIVSNIVIRGTHITSLDDLEISSVRAGFIGLESSLAAARSGVSVEDWKVDRLSISWTSPPGFKSHLKSWDATLRSQFWPECSLNADQASIKHAARLLVEFDRKRTYSQVSAIVFGLSDLLTVLHGIPAPIRSVVAYNKDSKQEASLFFRQHSDVIQEEPSVHDLLLPLTAFTEEQLGTLMNNWFDLGRSTELAVTWFCALIKNPMPYRQIEFVNLVQSLESIQRSLMGEKYMSDKEYKPIARALRSQIPENLPGDMNESLGALIGNGHRMTQSYRLRQLFEYVPVEFRALLIPHLDTFISKVVKTRNFLTHLDKSAESKSLTAYELPFANAGLQVLFQLVVFRLLEIPTEIMRLRLPRFRVYRTFRVAVPWCPSDPTRGFQLPVGVVC